MICLMKKFLLMIAISFSLLSISKSRAESTTFDICKKIGISAAIGSTIAIVAYAYYKVIQRFLAEPYNIHFHNQNELKKQKIAQEQQIAMLFQTRTMYGHYYMSYTPISHMHCATRFTPCIICGLYY